MEKQNPGLQLEKIIERLPMIDLALGMEHYDPNSLIYIYPLRPSNQIDADSRFNLQRLSNCAAIRGRVWLNDTPIPMLRLFGNPHVRCQDTQGMGGQPQLSLQSNGSKWIFPTPPTSDDSLKFEVWDSSGSPISSKILCKAARKALNSGELYITHYPISSGPSLDFSGPLFAQWLFPKARETDTPFQRSYIPAAPNHSGSKDPSHGIRVNTVTRRTLRRFEAIEMHPAPYEGEGIIIHCGSVRVFSLEKPSDHSAEETLVVRRANQGDVLIFERDRFWGLLNEHPEFVHLSVLNVVGMPVSI